MKHIILTFTSALLSLVAMAQVETTMINGKVHYVYPYQEEVTDRTRYYEQYADKKEILMRDDQNRKVISVEYETLEHTPAQIKNAKKASKRYIEQMEKYPYMMYDVKINLMRDITPAMEKLPDGLYVQYYRDLPYIKDRVLRYRNDVVAGIFSIKNNQLEGQATWYLPDGKIAKTGEYFNGSKLGVWSMHTYDENYSAMLPGTYSNMSLDEYMTKLKYDTITEKIQFKNGIRNGLYVMLTNSDTLTSGEYFDNYESGTWRKFDYKKVKTKGLDNKYYYRTTDKLILKTAYTINPNGKSRAKSVIVRSKVIARDYQYSYKNLTYFFKDTSVSYSSVASFPDFTSHLKFAEDKEELDLPEEDYQSFEGAEEAYYGYYGDGEYIEYGGYGYDYGMYYDDEPDTNAVQYSEDDIFKYLDGKRYLMNHLIDSIGYHYNYEGVMVQYHDNGQLMYRYEIRDGKLLEESPIYYDNGQVANVITFLADSNIYKQEFYDYFGKLYHVARFDAKGKALIEAKTKFNNTISINNREYDINWGEPTLDFMEAAKLKKGIETKELLVEKLWKLDSTVAAQGYFDPTTRTYSYSEYNLLKKPFMTEETTFGDDYGSVTSKMQLNYKNVQLDILASGSYETWGGFFFNGGKSDSVSPQTRILRWRNLYKFDTDRTLMVNGIPFTGKINAASSARHYKFSASSKAINYQMPTRKADQKAYFKTMKQYEKGKTPDLLNAYVPEFGGYGKITQTPLSLLYVATEIKNDYGKGEYMLDIPFIMMLENPDYLDDYTYGYDYMSMNSHKSKRSMPTSIEGQFLSGHEEGLWKSKDQFGKTLREFNYTAGELNGEYKMYAIEQPEVKYTRRQLKKMQEMGYYNEYGYDYEYERLPKEYRDAKPKKTTYYLNTYAKYANGYLNGEKLEMNWMGDTLSMENYVTGVQQGRSYERNKLFFSESYYEDGVQDGLTRTWLTPVGKDSVLLFELNFQNGALQGESVAYHTNGKVAKKGFFLSGQPIDDYEAFDTLGVRYQYVKFMYNQPVEEKIWEENQLSVRYEFDWKDSVYFNVRDITNATSIDRLINSIGFDDGSMRAPYYGRPSVLDKTGIDYTMTKYYPNDTVARTGQIKKGKKVGIWNYYNYDGVKLIEVNYFDTIVQVNDTLKFRSKGVLSYVDAKGTVLSKSWIIEKFEKYDCAHTDHNEERMLYCFWEIDTAQHRINGYVRNYYDNGSIQNEGMVKNGIPVGVWKMYDVDGHLSQVGTYNNGKRDGRWLSGDLGDVKNMSEICLNPNLQNLDEILKYQGNLLDISVVYYQNGKEIRREYYGINKNSGKAPDGYYNEDEYYYRY